VSFFTDKGSEMNKNYVIGSLFGLGIIAILIVVFPSPSRSSEPYLPETLEERVAKLEKTTASYSIPQGLFIGGEIEGYYDDKTYDSGWDSRAELQVGINSKLPKNALGINYAGATMTYDTDYALDSTLDNTVVEKQLGVGNDFAILYLGETDAQRIGFAKTPKIGAPIIITEKSSRIEHNEKTVLVIGGFQRDAEFDFDSYRLKKETPWGIMLGYDNKEESLYAGATVSLFGYADLSYMMIDTDAVDSSSYTVDTKQEGWAIGGSLHRFGAPLIWGIEMWDDKNTGRASKNRMDYGALYSINQSTYVTAHRTENDDLGYDGNYYGLVYNIHTNYDPTKRPDKQKGLEIGIYYHDKGGQSVFTGRNYTDTQEILGSIRYKF
jgi:hypothetical protein